MPNLAIEISRILMIILLSLMSVWAIIMAYLAVTIRPRFEKLFKDTLPSLSYDYLRYGEKMGRFSDYLDLIYDYEQERDHNFPAYRCYGGYNFREHISRFEFLAVKTFFLIIKLGAGIFAVLFGIQLYYFEQHQSDLMHKLLFVLFPMTIITGIITLIPYFYLKKRIMPRFEKMIQQKPLANPNHKIFFMGYVTLMSNYASHQRRNTSIYRSLKPYDILAHVSRLEIFSGKIIWRVGIVFLTSVCATFIWMLIRIHMMSK
ncbi:MAG TPA: hypothetical protein VHE99_07510 [Gammaproteobacteria bacterium]|nr:hypothetical protein [Gammaproteobacteria bacterium]